MKQYRKHPFLTEIEISELISIHYFEYTKDYKYPGESHDFWEIMYIDRGKVFITCNQNQYLLHQGRLIVLPPDSFHTIRADELSPSNVFIISFTARSSVLPLLREWVFTLSPEMKKLIHSIIQEGGLSFELPMPDRYCLCERKDAPFGSQQMVRLRLEELLIQAVRKRLSQEQDAGSDAAREKSRFDDQIAERVLKVLKEHIYGNLSMEEITDSLGYGKTYLSTVFKKVYGMSIMTCYTKLKMDEAKYLIRENTMSITEISSLLGFSSPQYFSKRFRQFAHMSPKQYEVSVKETWVSTARESIE